MPRSLQIRRGPAHDFTNGVVAESGADVKRHIFLPRIRRLSQSSPKGSLFDGVVTPATFDPESDPFDELYAGGNGFLDGKPLISESKPGDQDYNGGRWHQNVLKAGVDPDKYKYASSVEDLDLADFDSTSNYFECPLLPRRGGGRRP